MSHGGAQQEERPGAGAPRVVIIGGGFGGLYAIHIAFLTGYRNRAAAIATWWLAFTLDTRRERAFPTKQVGLMADIYDRRTPTGPARPARR